MPTKHDKELHIFNNKKSFFLFFCISVKRKEILLQIGNILIPVNNNKNTTKM